MRRNEGKLLQSSGGSLKDQKLAEEIRKLRIANDAKERKLVSRDTVVQTFAAFSTQARTLLDQKLENEYPAAVAGMDIPQARIFGKRLNDSICAEIRKLVLEWKI